jgi:hypothetical protein
VSATATRLSRLEADAQHEAHVRAELADKYEALRGWPPQRKQLDGMTAVVLWRDACIRHGRDPDTEILRSMPQLIAVLAQYLGWDMPTTGRRAKELYGARIKNWIDYLTELGYFAGREPVLESSREGRGILLRRPRRSSSAG